MGGRLFDAYIAVDWSARAVPSPVTPSPDAVWIGETVHHGSQEGWTSSETYHRTRDSCREELRTRLLRHVAAERRVFVGFDFSYGYPAGFASALGLEGAMPAWRLTWNELERLVSDGPDNRNNRFDAANELNRRCGEAAAGPFWGCPNGRRYSHLDMKSPASGYPYRAGRGKPTGSMEKFRRVDRREPGIKPVWQLTGTGSVGGQSLVGIPTVSRLRWDPDLAPVSTVWPFETGFTPTPTPKQGPVVLHAEIWPRIVPDPLDPTVPVKDQAQVRAVVNWLRRLDDRQELGDLFDRPPDLSAEALCAAVEEEGWIVGAGRSPRNRTYRHRSLQQTALPSGDVRSGR